MCMYIPIEEKPLKPRVAEEDIKCFKIVSKSFHESKKMPNCALFSGVDNGKISSTILIMQSISNCSNLSQKAGLADVTLHISISHERDYAVGMAILESISEKRGQSPGESGKN